MLIEDSIIFAIDWPQQSKWSNDSYVGFLLKCIK